MALDRPIFIVGSPRSGKTLAGRVLVSSPSFARGHEPTTIWTIGAKDKRVDTRGPEDATEEVVGRIRHEIERRMQGAEAERYVDESPHNSLRIPFCLAVFPDARFIHVVRDGREVIPEMLGGWLLKPELGNMVKTRLRSSEVRRWLRLSGILPRATTWASNWVRHRIGRRKKAWGPTVPGQAEFAKSHSLPETVAYQWLKIVEFAVRGLKEVSDDRVLEMRREKVLSNPGKEFERVAAFAEIQDPGPMIQVANDLIRPDREDPVIKAVQPSDEEWPKILKMIEPMQRELGYVHPGT